MNTVANAKYYYRLGFWTKADMSLFVEIGWYTAAEYKEITGDDYVASQR